MLPVCTSGRRSCRPTCLLRLYYVGTLRVELGTGVPCSGDHYRSRFRVCPKAEVPRFLFKDHRYHLKVRPFAPMTFGTLDPHSSVTPVRLRLRDLDGSRRPHGDDGLAAGAAGFPDGGQYLAGSVSDPIRVVSLPM